MQGDSSRIFYYHVPSAMVAFLFFAVSLCGSIGYLTLPPQPPDSGAGLRCLGAGGC